MTSSRLRALVLRILALALPFTLAAQEPRLANVSTLSRSGTGADVLTVGFVVNGTAPKQVVIRAIGPTLAGEPFNVSGTLSDPLLIVRAGEREIARNDNWGTPLAPLSTTAAEMTTAFGLVGAFALPAGSRDASIVATLQPGPYTAQVSGVGGTTGNALVEVYEVGAPAGKFMNLSARAQVGGAAGSLIPGFVVTNGGGTRKLLIRAAGPALTPLGVTGALANPRLALIRTGASGGTLAENDNWHTPLGTVTTTAAQMSAAFREIGAFAFANNSNDAALLIDVPPGSYTVEVRSATAASGIALVEIYDLSPPEPPVVTIAATKTAADETGSKNGEFTFTRTGPTTSPLVVRYGVGGSGTNGVDYVELTGSITIPAGASSVALPLLPNPDLNIEGTDTVIVTVLTNPAYLVGAASVATVAITDNPATLYIAQIRPDGMASGSTASGTATLLLSSDNSLAAISFTVSNLSSSVTSVHLRISPGGHFVFNLPYQNAGTAHWIFAPTGNYTSADLLAALREGRISFTLDTANYPQGEVSGTFVQAAGSRDFVVPASPPEVALEGVTARDAARFLTQATFGPRKADIDALTGGSISAWLDAQLALPFTSHRAAIQEDHRNFGGSPSTTNYNAIHPPNRQAAWWKVSLTAPDQLRQRVAFALSQIFVVSDVSLGDDSRSEPLAHYYDVLGNGAFGNFRTLLENVTLHTMMGEYLSHLRNQKADTGAGTTPDENYAREIMQLFTIGLSELQPDGTLVLGDDGMPVPTYNQRTIFELARVFTGWAYQSNSSPTLTTFRTSSRTYFSPMQLYAIAHDDGAKDLRPVLATPIPANQGGAADLRMALDALFNHKNTPPFVSRLLIQRLVTSNPSPGYVYRVAEKFRDNGSGTRGDLSAVIRAIYTDYEARSPAVAATPSFGKLKEPILRLTGLLRAFESKSQTGRYSGHLVTINNVPHTSATRWAAPTPAPVTVNSSTVLTGPQGSLAQAALRSPTVFNFFNPSYVLPGPLAQAGLVAPEFEITDDSFATSVPNFLRNFVVSTSTPVANATPAQLLQAQAALVPNLTEVQNLLSDVPALIDYLDLVLAAGNLSPRARTSIAASMAALPASTSALDRARTAVLLVLTSPGAAVQK